MTDVPSQPLPAGRDHADKNRVVGKNEKRDTKNKTGAKKTKSVEMVEAAMLDIHSPKFTFFFIVLAYISRASAVDSYRVEYSSSPFFDEAQALTVSCEADPEVQVVTTNATAIPEVQLVHLKMADDFSTDYPGATAYEVQASAAVANDSCSARTAFRVR